MATSETPTECIKCQSKSLRQDEDVLDTWFSSQLWPYATLGWPEETKELRYWFPNNWLMSGRDILFFWDARMIMSALELTGEVPFRELALHGLVRDDQGRKLSKSLGNSPDPLTLFDKHGADAIRVAIMLRYPMGRQDTKINENFFREGQGLIIKLWNSSRFLLMHLGGKALPFDSKKLEITSLEDAWLLSRLRKAVETHDRFLADSDFSHALEAVSNFFWNEYCDWYVEIIKPKLQGTDTTREATLAVALFTHSVVLKLLHPYAPFVTEELWQKFHAQGIGDAHVKEDCLMLASWPEIDAIAQDADAEAKMLSMMSLVRGIRDVRHNLGLPPKARLQVDIQPLNDAALNAFRRYEGIAADLGYVGEFSLVSDKPKKNSVPFKFEGGVASVMLPEGTDIADIKRQLANKIAAAEKQLSGFAAKLADENFVARARADIVEETRRKAAEIEDALGKLTTFSRSIGDGA